MVWVGLAIATLGFLVEFRPARGRALARCPAIREAHLDWVALVLFVAGCAMTAASHLQDQADAAAQRAEIKAIRTAVREVDAEVTVELTANWTEGKGPVGILTAAGHGADRVRLVFGDGRRIALQEVGAATFDRLDDGAIRFRYQVETTPGNSLVGQSFEDLEAATAIEATPIVSVPDSKTSDGFLQIKSIVISLRANEARRYLIRRDLSPPARFPADRLLRIGLAPGELARSLLPATGTGTQPAAPPSPSPPRPNGPPSTRGGSPS
jgi:hypothetical protein